MITSTNTTIDYYHLLGVSPNATQEEIKAAYRDKIRLYHPDLVSNQSESVRRAATRMTAQLNDAYSCLSDPDRRSAYDTGSRAGTTSASRTSTRSREADFTPPRSDPTVTNRGHWRRPRKRRVRDLTTISLGGIVLPLLVMVWTLSQFPVPTSADPALVAPAATGVVAATGWILATSQLLRRPDRLARIGVVWAHLMRWSGWILVGGCAVLLAIPALGGVLALIGVIASPFLGLILIALISGRSKDR